MPIACVLSITPYAAIRDDGRVIYWGGMTIQDEHRVQRIQASQLPFLLIRDDGSPVLRS